MNLKDQIDFIRNELEHQDQTISATRAQLKRDIPSGWFQWLVQCFYLFWSSGRLEPIKVTVNKRRLRDLIQDTWHKESLLDDMLKAYVESMTPDHQKINFLLAELDILEEKIKNSARRTALFKRKTLLEQWLGEALIVVGNISSH